MPDRFPLRSFSLLFAACFVIGLGSWLASRHAKIGSGPEKIPDVSKPPAAAAATAQNSAQITSPGSTTTSSRPPPRASARVVESPDPGRSPLAERLNDPTTSIREDGAILLQILENYRLSLGSNPTGTNAEITAQLSGRNSRRHAPLPAGLPAIDPEGNLVDRWGTPFFFHALSAHEMEIRSAGPDREIYTADDEVFGSPAPAR
ncbi:MAG: hypothetical protein ACREIA_05730 [Opitutaceae bacterium]